MGEPGTLIKFGELEHLKQIRREGLLYMNCLPYFWGIEDENLRGDPYDCNAQILKGKDVGITLDNGRKINLTGDWTYGRYPQNPNQINIFCMYALRPLTPNTFPIDDKNYRFGEYSLVLLNRDEFMDKILTTIRSNQLMAQCGLVEYIDDDYQGEVGPFRKRKKFSYQCEWRLVCLKGPGGVRTIRIGSLEDISVLMRSDRLNTELEIS